MRKPMIRTLPVALAAALAACAVGPDYVRPEAAAPAAFAHAEPGVSHSEVLDDAFWNAFDDPVLA
ncbi:MAG TPA: hypothetical protein VFO79_15295, partial [Xanthomonadales bacterium]|nr:hypothetical protein [Xanthomonadales bacterium]